MQNTRANGRISVSVAVGVRGQIGIDGELPWSIPSETNHFHKLIGDAPVLMGRKNLETSDGFVLNRSKIFVLSKTMQQSASNHIICRDIEDFCRLWNKSEDEKIFILGGESIYRLTLPLWNEVHISHVDYDGPADRFFPEIDWSKKWSEKMSMHHPQSEETPMEWTYKLYERASSA